MLITELLERNARLYPSDVALVEVDPEYAPAQPESWKEYALVQPGISKGFRREMTWSEFDDMANRVAGYLVDHGFGRGDKIAVLLMNSLEWLPVYFGILKTGALAVPLNFRYSSDEIKYCLKLADVNCLFFGVEFIERIAIMKDDLRGFILPLYIGEDCPDFALDTLRALSGIEPKQPECILSESDDAAIYFSSGTTGFPKAILHSHRALIAACETEQNHHGQTRNDIFLCIPPLYHTGAKMHWFGSLLAGSRGVLLRGTSPRWIVETAAAEKATIVWLLVPWAQDILDSIDRGEIDLARYDLSNWRLMHIGAQPVPPSLIKRWMAIFPNHSYDTNYGLSESTGPGAVHLGIENLHKVGAIGKAGYGWQTRVIDLQGNDVPKGEVGELALKGDGVMRCYYHDAEATADVMRGDWLRTGDMAKEDEDGFLFLVDRRKDVIITGGENLYPVQIEDFLRGNEKIKDCAVIGLADSRLGEIACAIIELKPGMDVTEQEIQEYCMELPRYKRPRRIIFAPVPRNATGKIEKPKLRMQYAGGSIVESQTTGS